MEGTEFYEKVSDDRIPKDLFHPVNYFQYRSQKVSV
jgi:hypothetical protein